MLFRSLVTHFIKLLPYSYFSENGIINFMTEFNYSGGRTDIVLLKNNKVYSFEAKISNWRKALDQAYKNTRYSHYSYILMPEEKFELIQKNISEFTIRSVGICYIKNEQIICPLFAQKKNPIFPWLEEYAKENIKSTLMVGC